MNRIRSQHRINVHGSDIPDPVCTFDELQSEYHLNSRILQNLRDAGLCSPTPIQMQAIPLMMHVSVETRGFSCVYTLHARCFMSCFVFGSGPGASGMCSHGIRKDSGFLRPAARPSAAACQPWLQSGDHLSNQRASQPGTQCQVVLVPRSPFSV